eukprot:TRINITY_DN34467_c0_g2_i1.p1 TRINITY_DN34467_c0_g2~~TRINITY_DN34467_c0_g2_i1.p1  ORF type:complete len:345 (-),score=22.83 TRINITY_DN34467_c0_g2_i1:119-1153(-)
MRRSSTRRAIVLKVAATAAAATVAATTFRSPWQCRGDTIYSFVFPGLGPIAYQPHSKNRRLATSRKARGGDSIEKLPKPRARGPRTEKDVTSDIVFGVVAVELLFNHDRLDMEVTEAFRRAVYDPVLQRLRMYSDSNTTEARTPTKSWRLQDRTLERQFCLSEYFTEDATEALQISRPQDPLLPAMRLDCRKSLKNADVRATEDPVSSVLIAWIAYNIKVGPVGSEVWARSRGRTWGYAFGKPEVSEWLLPVFADHDRSAHSERMALVGLGDIVKSAGGKLHPDSPVSGITSVYCSHTPCISCMAVFCQFKRRLPGVKLRVCFDAWGENRRWIDDIALRKAEIR